MVFLQSFTLPTPDQEIDFFLDSPKAHNTC